MLIRRARLERQSVLVLSLWFVVVSLLPLCGLLLAGGSLDPYFQFPPKTQFVTHASFSQTVFCAGVVLLILGVWWLYRGLNGLALKKFSWRGSRVAASITLLALALATHLAWERYAFFAAVQEHSFFLLWLLYILLLDQIGVRIGGASLFRGKPRQTLGLFAASALFWWLFEWLNRFAENWYYRNVEHYTAWEYGILATLSFSTVLPATLVTKNCLSLVLALEVNEPKVHRSLFGIENRYLLVVLSLSVVGLGFVGVLPNELFPLLWLSPLVILQWLMLIAGIPSFLNLRSQAACREMYLWTLAGLCCGFFWELWNWKSYAGWYYSIPYVETAKIFEMPVLGYGGYLPFGILCGLLCQLLAWTSETGEADGS